MSLLKTMAFSYIRPSFLKTSRRILDRQFAGSKGNLKSFENIETRIMSTVKINHYINNHLRPIILPMNAIRKYSKSSMSSYAYDLESDSDSDSDKEVNRRQNREQTKVSKRGESEFWRRKMRTLHRILDVNRDGVISFDDYSLLAKRFTDIGNLSPEMSAEFLDVMKQTWEEQWGEINPYNLVTAEQFLTELHHKLNDKDLVKKIGRFLPYVFKAVDIDHTGHLNLDQYKLFFRCLGLTDEDAAVSFAIIDRNGDGQLSLKEFVHLGRQYFLSENERKISRMFWGPLIDH